MARTLSESRLLPIGCKNARELRTSSQSGKRGLPAYTRINRTDAFGPLFRWDEAETAHSSIFLSSSSLISRSWTPSKYTDSKFVKLEATSGRSSKSIATLMICPTHPPAAGSRSRQRKSRPRALRPIGIHPDECSVARTPGPTSFAETVFGLSKFAPNCAYSLTRSAQQKSEHVPTMGANSS